ncbi:ATP-binding protein [Rhodococcus sp. NPDC059968]|uniref:ATP-binding protein n=1 Tax=Rhodococcus sp. NPDC059968 TaxID=3347017 RepID=UPI00366CFD2E
MTERVPGNLPAEVTSFVGRRRELAEAGQLLRTARLLTLAGPGGIGKSRMARQIAVEARRSFPDGAWLVELDDLANGEMAPSVIGSALGLFHTTTSPVTDLVEHLQGKQLLLIVDNCEHIIDSVAALLGTLLASVPTLRILATSRQVLGVEGEVVLPVRPLSTPMPDRPIAAGSDAVTLFAERATTALPGFAVDEGNRELVTGICQRLDGVPLAIELAAARLRAYSLEDILRRLDDSLHVLVSTLRTTPERHRTLESTLDWSYRLCSSTEQILWARLSVFADGFTVGAAEEVCAGGSVPRNEVFDLIAGLVDKSIVTRDGEAHGRDARLQMLGLLREFGAERSRESGEERAVRLRHRDYFRALALRGSTDYFSPRELEWSRSVRREHANIRAAVQFCQTELQDFTAVLEIVSPLQLYRVGASFVVEEYRWLSTALDLDLEPSEIRARALAACSYAASLTGDGDEGERRAVESEALAKQLGLQQVLADAACSIARASFFRGDSARTLELAREAAAICREVGNAAGACEALYRAAVTAFGMRDDRASEFAEASLALAKEHGSPFRTASGLWIAGLQDWWNGDQERATARLREAVRLYDSVGFVAGIAMCCEGLACAATSAGDYERAACLRGAADTTWRATAALFAKAVVRSLNTEPVDQTIRRALSEARYQAAFSRGAGFSDEETLEYAVGGHSEPPATRAPSESVRLTPRETEVAELVARGMSNRDIAVKLVIAQRTAEGHVERILNKLGFRSRAQIAAWVTERGQTQK